jgi:hypothetical protein
MRAFYATHKYIRLFVLGVPDGWLAALYDLEKRQWINKGDLMYGTLKEAKAGIQEKATALLGEKLPDLAWH